MGYKRPKPIKKHESKMKALTSKGLKPMFKYIQDQWGVNIKDATHVYFISPKGNVYQSTRAVDELDLTEYNINNIGIYFWEWKRDECRLSIEGSQMVGKLAKKNVIKLNDGLFALWMAGCNLEFKYAKKGYVIIKHKKDFVGCGWATGEKIYNFIPKIRRIVMD